MAFGFSCVLVLKSLACRPLSSSLLYHGCQMTAQAPGSHSCCRWEEEGRSRHLLLIRFCLLTLEEKPGTCIFISVVGIVIVWAPGRVRKAGKSSILATVLYKRGRQKGVVTGFWEANAVCCPEFECVWKTESLKIGLKDTELLICKGRNLGSKTCDSKSYSW